MSRSRVRVLVLVVLVVAVGLTPVASARTVHQVSDRPTAGGVASTDSVGSCFPPGGHRFEIGEFGPRMVVVVHTSLFPNVLGGANVTAEAVANGTVANGTVANGTVANGTVANGTGADGALQPIEETATGAFGLEASGTALDQRVVFLQTGVVYTGVEDAFALLSNPFDPFAVIFTYRFSLPVFDPFGLESTYESSESPVEGVETVGCSAVRDGLT